MLAGFERHIILSLVTFSYIPVEVKAVLKGLPFYVPTSDCFLGVLISSSLVASFSVFLMDFLKATTVSPYKRFSIIIRKTTTKPTITILYDPKKS